MDTQIKDKVELSAPRHGLERAIVPFLDEVITEGRRRAQLYRGSSRGDYRGRAEAVEEFVHWIEAMR